MFKCSVRKDMEMLTKKYTANEVIERIKEGWKTEEELKELYDFIESIEMKNDKELRKLCDSGYTNIVYDAYPSL